MYVVPAPFPLPSTTILLIKLLRRLVRHHLLLTPHPFSRQVQLYNQHHPRCRYFPKGNYHHLLRKEFLFIDQREDPLSQ